ncbi:MAG: hypothetical protein KC646_00075 [Candidatus Cloacimonetes bacterium]|nr:hypothetical protein [Candidatus Cloacimonadota bacterium]
MQKTKIIAVNQDLNSLFIQLSDYRLLSLPKAQLQLKSSGEVSTQDIFHVDDAGQFIYCDSLNFRLSIDDILSPYNIQEAISKLFHFEDFKFMSNRSIQRILPEIDHKDLIQAILHQDSDILPHITVNMSKRAAQMLKDDISYINKLEHADHLASKMEIEKVVNQLLDSSEISLDKSEVQNRESSPKVQVNKAKKIVKKKPKFQINYVIVAILAITFSIIFYTASEYFKLKKRIEISNKIKAVKTLGDSY